MHLKGKVCLEKVRTRLANLAVPIVASVTDTLSSGDRALPAGVDWATASALKDHAGPRAEAPLLGTVGCPRKAADTLWVLHISNCAHAFAAGHHLIGATTACICR
jgi:hypothetical protein